MKQYMVATDADGDQYIFAHSSISASDSEEYEAGAAIGEAVTNLGWTIVIRQEVEEAFAPIMRLTQNAQLVGAVILVLASLGALFVAQIITRPLLALTTAAEAMGAGDLDVPLPPAGGDEVGSLTTRFGDMAAQLSSLIGSLEQRVAERTQALAYRSVQLETAAQVSEAAGSILEPGELERQVVELIRERFDYYYVGLFLVDEGGEWTGEAGRWAVLRAGTGEAGQAMLEAGHKLEIGGESMIGGCVADGQARILLDVGEEAVRFDNPLLPETRSEMALPLVARGQVIGALTVQSEREAAFSDEDISILRTMATQVANAIQNARLFQDTQLAQREQRQRSDELGALHRLSLELAREQQDFDTVLRTIAQQAMTLLDADGGGIWLWRGKDQELELAMTVQVEDYGQIGLRLKPGEGLSGRAFAERRLQVVDDYPSWTGYPSQSDDVPFFAGMSAPMMWQDRVIGILAVTRSQPGRAFSVSEQNLAELLASQAAVFIQNARLYQETGQQLRKLAVLSDVSAALSASLERGELLQGVLKTVIDVMGFGSGLISLRDKGTGQLYLAAQRGVPEPLVDKLKKQGLKDTLCDVVFQTGRALALNDIRQGAPVDVSGLVDLGLLAYLGTPVSYRGESLGSLCFFDRSVLDLSDADLSLLEAIGGQVGVGLENARLFEDARRRATEMEALHGTSLRLATAGELNDILETVVEQAVTLLDAGDGGMYLYDQAADELEWVVGYGPGGEKVGARLKRGEGLSGKVMEEQRPIVVDAYDTWDERSVKFEDLPFTVVAAVPLLWQDELVGVLNVAGDRTRGTFTQDDVRLLTLLAQQAAATIQNARLLQEAQASLREITRLHQRYLQERWDEFLAQEEARQYAGYLFDQRGVQPAGDLWRPEIELAVARGRTLALTAEDEEWPDGDGDAKAALVVPLQLRDQIIGALDFFETDRDRRWSADDIALVESVADQVALAVENARAYQELQRTAQELREVDTLKSQFLANMSHELRTPLNSIIGFSRVMLKGIDGPLTDLQKADLTSIYNNGQHLLGLINDILDYSRIEAGKMELVFEPVDLCPIIDGVMSTAIGLVKDKPVKLIKEMADDLPNIRADSTRVRQVILNLVSNAAKFTEEGSITLRAWADDEMVTISVTDTGVGIPEDFLEKVFQEFQQVDGSATRRVGGTGLGLPISRHFVEMHGGRIWVESEVGGGSTFTFTIPIHGPGYVEDPDLAALEIDPGRQLVLAVEDSDEMMDFYRRYLEKHGYQIVQVSDGSRAALWVRELSPFAVLLDVLLPDADGWQVLEELKTSRETAHVPVIVCSIVDEQARGLSMGAAAYLTKPVLEDDLLRAMSLATRLQSV